MDDLRSRLLAVAARLLADGGPEAVSVRKVAAEVGTSTMAVYTHFGGKPELLRAVVSEGFRQFAARLGRVRTTADPVADLGAYARAYRRFALEETHLFHAMFARRVEEVLVGDDERAAALDTFLVLVDAVQRACDAGRLTDGPADEVALRAWAAVHGLVTIETGAGLQSARQAERTLAALVRSIAVGAGDDPAAARTSVP